ncbi:MAG: hypothetical protein KDD51_08025, partial [Bdellovibrionales bacterium]|nr:hypothetical protein [Bdellovibrionales bacterium]
MKNNQARKPIRYVQVAFVLGLQLWLFGCGQYDESVADGNLFARGVTGESASSELRAVGPGTAPRTANGGACGGLQTIEEAESCCEARACSGLSDSECSAHCHALMNIHCTNSLLGSMSAWCAEFMA